MFRNLPEKTRWHIFSFLNENDLANIPKLSKEIYNQYYKEKIKALIYDDELPEKISPRSYYQILNTEKNTLINCVTIVHFLDLIREENKQNVPKCGEILKKLVRDPSCKEVIKQIYKNINFDEQEVLRIKNLYKKTFDFIFQNRLFLREDLSEQTSIKLNLVFDVYMASSLNPEFSNCLKMSIQMLKARRQLQLHSKNMLNIIFSLFLSNSEELLNVMFRKYPNMLKWDLSFSGYASVLHVAVLTARPNLVKWCLEKEEGALNRATTLEKIFDYSGQAESRIICCPPLFHAVSMMVCDEDLKEPCQSMINILLEKKPDLSVMVIPNPEIDDYQMSLKKYFRNLCCEETYYTSTIKHILKTCASRSTFKML